MVDAVVELPHGSHPGNMPYSYYFDEEHMAIWLKLSETDEGVKQYLEEYVYGARNYDEYLERIGGSKKLDYLKDLEQLRARLTVPWAKR